MGKACILKTNGTIEALDHQPSYAEAVKIVGGYIEYAPAGKGKTLICNEEGLLERLPFNAQATKLYNEGNPANTAFMGKSTLVGNVILLEGWRGTKS